MIKLTAISAPDELTYDVVKELTEQYQLTGESVWNQPYIKKALLSMSNNKCCYCECKIDEESKYLEVE
ncbi:MAG: HNH endonuclease, partial [Sphingobacteriaceae bacterium]